MMNNLPPFYVGQKVVCVETHPDGLVIRGQKFRVKGLKRIQCCGGWTVDVGLTTEAYSYVICGYCGYCGGRQPNDNYFRANRFAPLQQSNFPLMTFTAIKEKEQEQILILN